MTQRPVVLLRLLAAGLLALPALVSTAAPAHPKAPLTADEMLAAANIVLQGRAAQPGAVF